MDRLIKQEGVKSGSQGQLAENMIDPSSSQANLAAQIQLMQASGQLPAWMSMISPYQMMVLPQGVSPSLFSGQNVLAMQDNPALLVQSMNDATGQNHQTTMSESVMPEVKQQQRPNERRPADNTIRSISSGGHQFAGHSGNMTAQQQDMSASFQTDQGRFKSPQPDKTDNSPKPPKKPLTPYMIFSKQIWPQVKAANSHLSSVCEIGAVVGGLWRDLGPNDKQIYNELFIKDKERYDNELRSFLKTTGMHASDLVKPKAKRTSKPSTRPSAASATLSPSGQQMAQTLMGMTSQSPRSQQGGNSATPSASLPNFSQAWTGQTIGSEQILAQMGLGLSGYTNSDGSISLDNSSLANLIIQQAQQQQSLQLVSSGSQQAPYCVAPATTTDDNSDHVRSWVWSQQQQHQQQSGGAGQTVNETLSDGVVLYQLPSSAQSTDQRVSGGQNSHAGEAPNVYSVDANGQIIKHKTEEEEAAAVEHRNRLQAQVDELRSALNEKSLECQRLTHNLDEAYRIIDSYKQLEGCREDIVDKTSSQEIQLNGQEELGEKSNETTAESEPPPADNVAVSSSD